MYHSLVCILNREYTAFQVRLNLIEELLELVLKTPPATQAMHIGPLIHVAQFGMFGQYVQHP